MSTIIIETNIPLPVRKAVYVKKPISARAQEILDTLQACKDGDSFLVDGADSRTIASVAGRMAKRLGCSIKSAGVTGDQTRVWRIAARVGKKKVSK